MPSKRPVPRRFQGVAVPRYFIDTTDGDVRLYDAEGEDFADAEAARLSALAALPGVADDPLPDGEARDFSVTVRGESGITVYVARLTFHGEWMAKTSGRRAG